MDPDDLLEVLRPVVKAGLIALCVCFVTLTPLLVYLQSLVK
jgi:hypothetical protein